MRRLQRSLDLPVGLHDSKSEQNDQGWNEPRSRQAPGRTPSSLPIRTRMYKKIEEIAAEETPIMPIYFYAKVFMQKTNVKGWPFDNVEQIWYAKDMYKVAE